MDKKVIAGNNLENDIVNLCFKYISEEDAKLFTRKFSQQSNDSVQIKHTLRELILGAYISSQGYRVKAEFNYYGKTPDWCIMDDKKNIISIIELTNFHIDKGTENIINHNLKNKKPTWYWRDGNKDNIKRLYQNFCNKAQVYRQLVKADCLPYIIAVFIDSLCLIDSDELKSILYNNNTGLFNLYPEITSVIVFNKGNGTYLFNNYYNPNELKIIQLMDGIFPKLN